MRRRTSSARIGVTLGLSVALHTAVIGALAIELTNIPPPLFDEAQVVELELEQPRLAPAPEPEVQPTPPLPALPALRTHKPRPRVARRLVPAPAPHRTPPRRTGPPMKLAMRKPELDLLPSPLPPPPPPPAPERTKEPPNKQAGSVKQRLDDLLAADQAQRNVMTGDVHPRLYDIKRDAEYFFKPGWGMSEGDRRKLGTVGSTSAAFLRGVGRNYLTALKQHADSGHGRPRDQGDDLPTMLETYSMMRRAAEQDPANRLRCTLCVTVAWGQAPRLVLRRSSHRRAFDRLARRALSRAVRRRPPTRNEKPVRACYRVEASFSRVPPLPVVGCTFDEVKPSLNCFYPFKKVLKTRLTLVSARYLGE